MDAPRSNNETPGRNYQALIDRTKNIPPVKTVVVHPCDQTSLAGVVDAAKDEIIDPILVGPKQRIAAIADEHGFNVGAFEIIDTEHSHESADRGAQLLGQGSGELLMKGSLHTDEFMGAVMHKDAGLRTERRISHVFAMDVPSYNKPLLITDAAINIFPDLMVKRDIVQNAIDLLAGLTSRTPKVAILSAVETVTPKIPSTIDAAALCKMADRGQITGGILDGPLALDNAISPEAANIKGINSPVAGDADILLTPDLEAGNMLAKNLTFLSGALAAGIVLGARVPIVLTSRADAPTTRVASCAIAALYADYLRRNRPIRG